MSTFNSHSTTTYSEDADDKTDNSGETLEPNKYAYFKI